MLLLIIRNNFGDILLPLLHVEVGMFEIGQTLFTSWMKTQLKVIYLTNFMSFQLL